MDHESLRRTCLAATVAVAWTASADNAQASPPTAPSRVYLQSEYRQTVNIVRFVGIGLGSGSSGGGGVLFTIGLGSGAQGINNYAFDVPTGSDGQPIVFETYGIFAKRYNSSSASPSVSASFVDPVGGLNLPFETVFQGFDETAVANSIESGDPAVLLPFANYYASLGTTSAAMGTAASSIGFSNGTLDGTVLASFTVIPEPGSVTVCLGAVGLVGFLRRRAG